MHDLMAADSQVSDSRLRCGSDLDRLAAEVDRVSCRVAYWSNEVQKLT